MVFDLDRFVEAQEGMYEIALREIRAGKKHSHWMWFVFPQLKGLGKTGMSNLYGIDGVEEAMAYLAHPVLGARLREITEALLQQEQGSAEEIFGFPDVLKLRSCMTLFREAAEERALFQQVLDRFYQGKPDGRTLSMLGK